MRSFYRENFRWLLGGFLLTFFSAFGQTFFISIWGAEIREAYVLSHGQWGGVYMLATLASALTLPFFGRLVDVVSAAQCSAIVILGLTIACLIMASGSSIIVLLIAVYMLRLFGQGMMTHTAITAMGRWYAENRGKAVSTAGVGHQVSEAVAPTLIVALAMFTGWRGTWYVAAPLLVLVALPSIFVLMRVERVPRTTNTSDVSSNEVGHQWKRSEVLRDKLFWLTCLGLLSPAFIGTSVWFHQAYLIELNSWAPEKYYGSFALMAATTFVFTLVSGFMIDRWSAMKILPIFMAPLGFACLTLGYLSAEYAIYLTMVLIGVSYGFSSSIFGALWPEVYGVRHLGGIRSIVMALMVFSSAAGPGLTGVLIDLGIPFTHQLKFIGIYCLLCGCLILFVSLKLQDRRKLELLKAS